jgi:sialic acid synthase SpsE
LLDAVDKTGKDVYLSVGACTMKQIKEAVARFNIYKRDLTVLYCNASYPSRYCDVRLITDLKYSLPEYVSVGFSDHTTDVINAPALAVHFGAEVIEKHFTAYPDMQTPDRGHSLTPEEFHTMVKSIKANPVIAPTAEESDFVKYHQCRFVEGKGYVRVRKL